jgi:hypothetical protein
VSWSGCLWYEEEGRKSLGTRKRENLYIRLLMGDLTIKFTRHIRNSPIFVMTRICPNDVAADHAASHASTFKGNETPIGGRSATCEVVGGSDLQGCTEIKALAGPDRRRWALMAQMIAPATRSAEGTCGW